MTRQTSEGPEMRAAVARAEVRSGARITRRATLGLGLGLGVGLGAGSGAGALAGCSLNNPLAEEKTPAVDAVRDLAPDVAVAVEAAALVQGAKAAAVATGEQHAGLAPRLSGLLAAHQAHLEAVVDAVPEGVDTSPGSGTAYVVPASPTRALARVTEIERALHDRLVGLALRAESGAFARLLGAMAAAISQQLRGLAS